MLAGSAVRSSKAEETPQQRAGKDNRCEQECNFVRAHLYDNALPEQLRLEQRFERDEQHDHYDRLAS